MIGTRGYFKEGFLMIKLIASDMDGTFLDGNECEIGRASCRERV